MPRKRRFFYPRYLLIARAEARYRRVQARHKTTHTSERHKKSASTTPHLLERGFLVIEVLPQHLSLARVCHRMNLLPSVRRLPGEHRRSRVLADVPGVPVRDRTRETKTETESENEHEKRKPKMKMKMKMKTKMENRK